MEKKKIYLRTCIYCGNGFEGTENAVSCQGCKDKNIKSRKNRQMNEYKYKCNYCGEEFRYKIVYKEHIYKCKKSHYGLERL